MSGSLSLNAESLYGDLLRALQPQWGANDRLVGITSGGAWLAERLQADLGLSEPAGVISSAMHRDDFSRRGLADGGVTRLPFEIEGAHLWIIDDVLYTGRTVRAVINELYDYGRPASVRLAVLVDRGGRELPIQADCAAARLSLPADQKLSLQRDTDGRLTFSLRG
jgi:pyrimidine operon attenuation protein / uracil phosphoribosyltransferase